MTGQCGVAQIDLPQRLRTSIGAHRRIVPAGAMEAYEFPEGGPAQLVSGLAAIGGGRGVFAAVDIPAGGLILSEKPIVHVPDDKAPEVGPAA